MLIQILSLQKKKILISNYNYLTFNMHTARRSKEIITKIIIIIILTLSSTAMGEYIYICASKLKI